MHHGAQAFPDFVAQNERRSILAVQIAAELEGAMSLRAIRENRQREQMGADRQFPICEDRPRGHRELVSAGGAFPELAGRQGINLEASAFRTIRLSIVIGPTDRNELGMRFLIRHARNGAQRERPGGCGKEEVLRHNAPNLMSDNIKFSD